MVVASQDFCHLICKRPDKLVSVGENTRVYYNRLFSQTTYLLLLPESADVLTRLASAAIVRRSSRPYKPL